MGGGVGRGGVQPGRRRAAWPAALPAARRPEKPPPLLPSSLLLDVGLPATHAGVRYNCRAFLINGKIALLRPKSALADDGNYREARWFVAWRPERGLEEFRLPAEIAQLTGQEACPFGHAYLQLDDATLAAECCEELFTPAPPHAALALAGVEVFGNGSGSHHQARRWWVGWRVGVGWRWRWRGLGGSGVAVAWAGQEWDGDGGGMRGAGVG